MSDPKFVYIVDDHQAVRDSLAFFLTTVGFTPQTYGSGSDFLDVAPNLAPGCVLLDVRMPGLDGLQVAELLGENLARLPVIIMTGHGDVQIAVKAMKLGATDFIEKPFAEQTMIDVVESTLSKLAEHCRESQEQIEARKLVARLTPRETEVLRGLIDGRSNKVLAFDLGLSNRTVEMHRANMMMRLGARSLSDALKIAFSAGLTSLPRTH